MKKYLLLIAFLSVFYCAPQAIAQSYSRIRLDYNLSNMAILTKIGVPTEDISFEKASMTLELSEYDLEKLTTQGIPYTILIPDLSKYYTERNQGVDIKKITQVYKARDDYQVPEGFELGSMGGYFTYNEMIAHLHLMAQQYPNLVKPLDTLEGGLTHQGRPLLWMKISDNPLTDEDNEPEVLYTGAIHAREPISISLLIYFMYYLLENYENDPEIQHLLNYHELYLIPCINPDGYIYNETTNPDGGGMWRKNRRNNGNGTFGVDLNRNFGYQWGYDNTGSSPIPGSDTYRGPAAFSEPETQLVRDFCIQHNFQMCLNYHSYGNLMLYPWGYINVASPDETALKANAMLMTLENHYSSGRPGQLLYNTNGDANDWMYGDQTTKPKIFAYVPEVGSTAEGFWPEAARIIPLCSENVLPCLRAVQLAGTYAGLTCPRNMPVSGTNINISFSITRMGATPAQYTVWVEAVTPNFLSTGNPVNFMGMSLQETRQGSIPVTLSDCMLNGEEIRFNLCLSDGLYLRKEEISWFYGQKSQIFNDPASNLSNWTTNLWGPTTQKYVSPPSCLTDSPGGNYQNSQINDITLSQFLDLTRYVAADISFSAQWKLEPAWDFVQLKISTDGINWTPLSGNYTKPGGESQATGEPVYDGTQTAWITENIDITDFCGHPVKFRFTLESDGSVAWDGFYFDDFRVNAIDAMNDQVLLIPEGWSGISGYLNPPDQNMDHLFAAVVENLVLVKDFESVYWPEQNIQTLPAWNALKGYMIKTTQEIQLPVGGIPVTSHELNFIQGWNLVPAACPCGISVTSLADQASGHLKLLVEVAGNRIYWPEMNIHTLWEIEPGKAYFGYFDQETHIQNLSCE